MKFYGVKIESRDEAGGYTLLRYRWDGPIEPGQFVMARTTDFLDTLDPLLARPLSFYDHDGETASLLLEVRGRGTALLDRSREIEVSAPLGRGFSTDGIKGRAALLGGGIGVAPMKILSRRLDDFGVDHDVFLGFADSLTSHISRDFPEASVATMDGSEGVEGTILDIVGQLEDYAAVYACGPNPMLAAVKQAAGSEGIRQLSVEERMGCGNGSCNGCVVPVWDRGYVRSCIEGPVFDAGVLAW